MASLQVGKNEVLLEFIDKLRADKKLIKDIINETDKEGNTALLLAAKNDHKPCVIKLIKHGSDVNHQNGVGWNLIHFMARSKEKVEFLKDKDFNKLSYDHIMKPDNRGNTPLHHAAFKGNIEFLEKIYIKFEKQVGKNICNTVNERKGTPLHLAIQGDKGDALLKLIDMSETKQQEIISIKEAQDDLEKIKDKLVNKSAKKTNKQELFKNKRETEQILKKAKSPFSKLFRYAAAHGKYDCLTKLYENYVSKSQFIDINFPDPESNGMTPLHYLVKYWRPSKENVHYEQFKKCFLYLLDLEDININTPNKENKTPLHFAAEADNLYCLVKMLVNNPQGKRVFEALNKDDATPALAAKLGSKELSENNFHIFRCSTAI
ncbi:ankyrin repeat domain-containing protein, partial [Endozoicomonas sp. ONNA2]|uniref:ankyrin repeat domain-containing protein n=1 Tax=Endozoicomonas sp. ONNA2 TaxID=2828741 RepID=UPI0021481345